MTDGSAWCSAAPCPPVPILLNSRVTSHIQFICPCHLSDWSSLLLPPGAVGLGAVVALPPGPGPPFCPGPRRARPRFRAGLRCWLASSASPRARLRGGRRRRAEVARVEPVVREQLRDCELGLELELVFDGSLVGDLVVRTRHGAWWAHAAGGKRVKVWAALRPHSTSTRRAALLRLQRP